MAQLTKEQSQEGLIEELPFREIRQMGPSYPG